jgi:hypothetical protein
MLDRSQELSAEAKALLDRLKAAKQDQRTHHAETLEFLQCVQTILGQVCQVCTPEHLPGRYRSRSVVLGQAQALRYHIADLRAEIDPE